MTKKVKRLSDGEIIDVPVGHWALNSPLFEEVKEAKPTKKAAKKSPGKAKG